MSNFGDFDEADAFDTELADPEQVAIKLHKLRIALGEFDGRRRRHVDPWEDLDEDDRAVGIAIVGNLLAWLRRQGALH